MKYPQGRIKEINFGRNLIEFKEDQLINVKNMEMTIELRSGSTFKNKGFFLSLRYDWTIVQDVNENLCLVPTKKGELK